MVSQPSLHGKQTFASHSPSNLLSGEAFLVGSISGRIIASHCSSYHPHKSGELPVNNVLVRHGPPHLIDSCSLWKIQEDCKYLHQAMQEKNASFFICKPWTVMRFASNRKFKENRHDQHKALQTKHSDHRPTRNQSSREWRTSRKWLHILFLDRC